MSLLECVANFSEGSNELTIERVTASATSFGSNLADLHYDPDHNRAVMTMIGSSETLVKGMVAATRAASDLINLKLHKGVHPRMGAMDVIPFVPLPSNTMADAVNASIETAMLIGEMSIPVFLYGHASRDRRTTLPQIRRDAFEAIDPDYGPSSPHSSAGAVCVGARDVLVAFNVNLESDDLSIAKGIAREIRESSGGLPDVRAMGVWLDRLGKAQVSMNLVKPETTTITDAFEAVKVKAAEYGVTIDSSEVVGLATRGSVGSGSQSQLKLRAPIRYLEDFL